MKTDAERTDDVAQASPPSRDSYRPSVHTGYFQSNRVHVKEWARANGDQDLAPTRGGIEFSTVFSPSAAPPGKLIQ